MEPTPSVIPLDEITDIRGVLQRGFGGFTSCAPHSGELWHIYFEGQAADAYGSFVEDNAELPCLSGHPVAESCFLYLEGRGVVGELGATDLLGPERTEPTVDAPAIDYDRQAIFTELGAVELVSGIEEGCLQDAGR